MNALTRKLLTTVDWTSYEVATGPADHTGEILGRLLSSSNIAEASEAWERIEDSIFSQGTIYSAAEPTVPVLLAALLDEQPPWRSGRIIDLLFFIVTGCSPKDASMRDRCRDRAREGLLLLTRWVLLHEGWDRENALAVIDVVAPDRAGFIRLTLDV